MAYRRLDFLIKSRPALATRKSSPSNRCLNLSGGAWAICGPNGFASCCSFRVAVGNVTAFRSFSNPERTIGRGSLVAEVTGIFSPMAQETTVAARREQDPTVSSGSRPRAGQVDVEGYGPELMQASKDIITALPTRFSDQRGFARERRKPWKGLEYLRTYERFLFTAEGPVRRSSSKLISIIGLAVAIAGNVESMNRSRRNRPMGVLHVPYTYFPDPCGGTEVYVRGLAQRLCALGYASAVAAPSAASSAYEDAGLPVHRFATDLRPRLDLAYGVPDDIAAENFKSIVMQTRPAILHLHARTAAISEKLIDVAHAAGASVVFTYHTPTASCARGTMMLFGKTPCDGLVMAQRCAACALSGLGVPLNSGAPSGWLPDAFYAPTAAIAERCPIVVGVTDPRSHRRQR